MDKKFSRTQDVEELRMQWINQPKPAQRFIDVSAASRIRIDMEIPAVYKEKLNYELPAFRKKEIEQ